MEKEPEPTAKETGRAGIRARSELRRERMVTNLAADYQAAEDWDLEFWQSQTPEERLSALIAIRRDVAAVEETKKGRS